MRRASLVLLCVCAVVLSSAPFADATPRWERRLRKVTRTATVSVLATSGRRVLFERRAAWRRVPASNQKLLLSMALLDELGPDATFPTIAWAEPKPAPLIDAGTPDIRNGRLRSDVWITGSGDPTIAKGGMGYGRHLSVHPTWIASFARKIKRAGIEKIDGRIIGVRSRFLHDWDAPGWEDDFNDEHVALPSALSIDGNVRRGRHITDPELRFARTLTKTLESKGVEVHGGARAGKSRPSGLARVAGVRSRPLKALLGHMNRSSSNFFAEVLGKALAVAAGRRPGTIARGAATLRSWTDERNVVVKAYDASGLSYANRVSTRDIVDLLRTAEDESWGEQLFLSLPKGGWGTLENRLHDVRLRAKTGTLDGVSSLSGWLWLERSERWARFSIIGNGRPTWQAKGAEDEIVRLISTHY